MPSSAKLRLPLFDFSRKGPALPLPALASGQETAMKATIYKIFYKNGCAGSYSPVCLRIIGFCFFMDLLLRRLQAFQQPGKEFIPRPRTGELQDEATGVPDNFPTHINDASHDGLHAAACCLFQPQRLGIDHVLVNDFEHVVNEHPHFQERTVYREFAGRQPFHIHFRLKLCVILLACAPLPVGLQNLFFCCIKACPCRENDCLRRPQELPVFAADFGYFKNHADRIFNSFNRPVHAALVDSLFLCLLNKAAILLCSLKPLRFCFFAQIMLDDKPGVRPFIQKPEKICTVKASVGYQQERGINELVGVIQALINKFGGSGSKRMGASFPELGIDHPSTAKMSKYGGKAVSTIISWGASLLFRVGIVKDGYINIHTYPGMVSNARIIGIYTHLSAKIKGTLMNTLFKSGTGTHVLKPLPEDFCRWYPVDTEGVLKERVLRKLLYMVKIGFALGNQAAEASKNVRIGNLRLFHPGNTQACIVKAADAGHLANQRESGMTYRSFTGMGNRIDLHAHLPPSPGW